MFEQTVNKYFKKDAFKTGDSKVKFHYMGWEQNPYVDYLTSKSKSASPSNVLKAVLYTIARTPFVWNIGAPMFKDVRKLPSALKTKILNSIPDKHFMKLVENNCMDYHILGIPFKQYPIDTLMVSILEVFPVLYSNKEFTNDELKKFASIQPKRTSIVIDGKSSFKLISLKDISKEQTFSKDAKGLVQLFLTIGNIPQIKDQKVLDKLASILKCK